MSPELASKARGTMTVTARWTAMRWPLTGVPRKDWNFFSLLSPFHSHKQGHFFFSFRRHQIQKNQRTDTEPRKRRDKDSHLPEVKHRWARPEQVRVRFSGRKTLPTLMYLLLKTVQFKRQRYTAQSDNQCGTAHKRENLEAT